jgi:preprotein translocase subunit SecF
VIDFVGQKHWVFLISAIAIFIAIISLAIFGLKSGVDFSGGTSVTLQFEPQVGQAQLRQEMAGLGYESATIQGTGEGSYIIHIKEMTRPEVNALAEELGQLLGSQVDVHDYYLASATVGMETARNAGIAIAVAAVAMLLYIVWAFRRMPKPLRWGTCAVVALIHDVLIVLGVFSLLGHISGVEVNAMFITGVLTVVGYSINNTVVVFDRVRENISKHLGADFGEMVNASLNETVGRSLNTSLTTLCVILAMLLFGGATIHPFVLVLFIGVLAGTYSSLGIAGPLLVVWEKGEWGQLLSRLHLSGKTA